jgi:hypothetical protein
MRQHAARERGQRRKEETTTHENKKQRKEGGDDGSEAAGRDSFILASFADRFQSLSDKECSHDVMFYKQCPAVVI